MSPFDLHSNSEHYSYTVTEGGIINPIPPVPFNANDTGGGYQYHTFAIEMLPHEVRFLIDSNVVRRVPDRLIPRSSPYSDMASRLPRMPVNIHPAEIDMDNNYNDPFGLIDSVAYITGADTTFKSFAYQQRHYFETHPHNPGFWDVIIGGVTYHAAHHLLDYVKVWDLPADMKVPGYPH